MAIEQIEGILSKVDGFIASYGLTWVLLASAVFFTLVLRFPQLVFALDALKVITERDAGAAGNKEHISPFEAVAISLGTRVGIGSIVGVGLAISLGGSGSIFWMWVVAFLGGALSFAENTLGQLYKTKDGSGFKGGPAYYIYYGLRSKLFSAIFAGALILVGWTFISLYSNNSVASFGVYYGDGYSLSYWKYIIGGILAIFAATMFFGGGRFIAKFTSYVTPFMTISYIILVVIVILVRLDKLPSILYDIFANSLNFSSAAGGFLGSTVVIGIQRALFATEAGLGSAPNAAASAHTSHPCKQGIAQAFVVFADIVICSCSALFVLFLVDNPSDFKADPMLLMQTAMNNFYGEWGMIYLTALLVILASTVTVGAYYVGSMNIKFINSSPMALLIYRIISVAVVFGGALTSISVAWVMANITMSFIVFINLFAVVSLYKIVIICMKDYKYQRKRGINPTFRAQDVGITNTQCWD